MARMGFEARVLTSKTCFLRAGGRRPSPRCPTSSPTRSPCGVAGADPRPAGGLGGEPVWTGINVGARSADELRAIAEVILG